MRAPFRAVVTVALAVAGWARAEGPAPSEDRMRRLEAGEIIVSSTEVAGFSLPRIEAVAIIQAPPHEVWAIVQDCSRYSQTMPRTLESAELERDGDRVHCRVTLDMPFPFGDLVAETDAVHTVDPGRSYRREWSHRGGDFKSNRGSWTLEPRAGGAATLATYEALAEPKVAIPTWMLRSAQAVTLPSMMEGLRSQLTRP